MLNDLLKIDKSMGESRFAQIAGGVILVATITWMAGVLLKLW